jgi:hypothetical protein
MNIFSRIIRFISKFNIVIVEDLFAIKIQKLTKMSFLHIDINSDSFLHAEYK